MAESYSVNAVISAVDSNFSSTFRSAAKSVSSFQAGTQTGLGQVGATVSKIGGTLTKGITLPLGLMAIAAAKTSMDFGAQMSRVQAISGATGKQMGAMKKQAIDLGAKTAFSAKQAAEGMENLASAGMNSTQIMRAMPGVLNLAAVSGGDVAKAAENMSTALNAFGLSAGKSSHVADVFAKAAAKTNAEASDMGEALKYVAPQAHAAGLSLEETSAAIGLLSDNGLKVSTAGTTLAQALMRVQKPSAEAQKAMDKLGFSAYDSGGKMKPLAKQVSELKGKMKGMTDEQKANTLATIYGMEGGRAMNVLLGEQDGKLAALTKSLKNSKGSAADMAKIMQDNAKSAVEQLGGAFESAAIVIGDKMAPTIKSVANTIAALVGKFNDASPAVQNFVLAMLGIAAAVGPLMMIAGKLMTLTAEFATLGQSIKGLGPAMKMVSSVMSKAFAGAAIFAGIMLIVKGFRDLYNTSATFRNIVNSVANAVGGVLSAAFKVAGAAVQIAVNAFKSLNKSTGGILGPILEIVAGVAMVAKAMQSLGIASTIASTAMKAFGLLSNPWVLLAVAIAAAVAGLVYFFTQTKTGQQIVTTVVAAIQAAWQTFATFMGTLWTGIVTVATAAWNLLVTLMTPVITAIMAIWQSLSAYFSTLWTSIVTVATATWNMLVTIFTPIIAAIMAAWQVLSPFFAGLFQGIVTIITTVVSVIQSVWTAAWSVVQAVVTAAWSIITSIVSGALNVIAGIINAVTAAIQGNWSGAWSAIQGVASTIWNTIKSVVTTGINAVKSVITSVLTAIQSVFTSIWNAIKSVVISVISGIRSSVSSGMSAIRSVVSSIMSGIQSVFTSGWNTVKSIASNGIRGAANAVKSVASNMVSAGRDFVMGFVRGISGAIKSAADAAANMARSAVDAAKSFLHIHSPSRIMRNEVGKYVALGMAVGIQKNTGAVIDASEAMARAAVVDTDQFQLTDAFGSVNTGLNNSSLTGAMEHELNVANDWTVEVPVNLDGQEVARITAKPMQQELNRMDTQNNRIHGQR
ncbi:MAG: phage tail tape measure protein [Lactobacillus sp.]|nr:MAG: phage tail tape measure protein [Lactobacillus sp.]